MNSAAQKGLWDGIAQMWITSYNLVDEAKVWVWQLKSSAFPVNYTISFL